ncbi:peptidyl-prolyl cis-trans isomerase D isoform X2 [Cylas formicarius]|uniref:peptidyl-prolyl cis-trans isomerase D isoform X2 n=1 Tax=Cylas formicarius TaxID=197179 RepID=UPI00295858B3|nr:peptidyl-prolyl cis-trans isomerase D isoform X2 [Cylas formicarius]
MTKDNKKENQFVYFDFVFNNVKAGRVIIELFSNTVPKSAENFRALCTGENGIGKHNKPLHYKGTKIHRVVPLCLVQGGDIINGDGSGGESIYGDYFDDENLELTHNVEGIVGMSNDGPDRNTSQFYITTQPCPHLDESHVIVGKVVKGLNIIVEMSDIPKINDIPLEDIIITDCGEIKPGDQWNYSEKDGTDIYPPWPNDWDINPTAYALVENAIKDINKSGNIYFRRQHFFDAERKYKKTLRYIDWYLNENKNNNKDIREFRNMVLLNLTAARLKVNKNKEALIHCNEVIKNCPKNGKAYYRRAKARLALSDYDEALKDLDRALALHPNDSNVRDVIDVAKKLKLKYLKTEQKFCAKFFKD